MSDPDKRGVLAGIGIGAALLVCCALPLLLTAGALGGFLSSPWLWVAAGLVLAIALVRTATRMRSASTTAQDSSSSPERGEDCCPPPRDNHSRAEPPAQQQADNNDPADKRFPR